MGTFALDVECSNRDAHGLLEQKIIYCQLETDDSRMYLIGFTSEKRRSLYKSLLNVNGIGRRSALTVLDCGEAIDILRAVAGADKSFFKAVPGVGSKRIDMIIGTLGKRYQDALPSPIPGPVENWVEARDALCSQGLAPQDADKLLQKIATKDASAEELFQAAAALNQE